MKWLITTILFLSLVLVVFSVSLFILSDSLKTSSVKPNTQVTPTFAPQELELTGWLAAWDDDKAQEVLPPVMKEFKTFAPMLYRVMPDSSLGEHEVSTRETIIRTAREHNVPIAPVITDESDTVRIYRLLTVSSVQEEFIDSLVEEARRENFTGWSIDIEKLKGSDRQAFSAFIKNVSIKLHENNLKLYVIVYGRQEEETYDPARAHDFKTLGQYADQIQIMTYNYNNEFTDPGGQTPLNWYRSVLQYAVKTVPREKILVGLSTHGYDWDGDEVTGLTYPEVEEIISGNNTTIKYDASQAAQVARYRDSENTNHILLFEDAKSIVEKMKVAQREFGINKFAFWRLSAEDPKLWDVIKNAY